MSTPAQHLLAQHKLLSRLSGQVVWNLAEEAGADPVQLDAFMDFFEKMKRETAALMEALAQDPQACLLLTVERPESACPQCTCLDGLRIAAGDPKLLDYLPPFSLGCCVVGRLAQPNEGEPATETALLPQPPKHRLCCEQRPLSKLLAEQFPR